MSVSEFGVNLQDASQVCDLLDRAAEAYRGGRSRRGSTVELPDRGRLVATGDLHDHGENLGKAVRFARLDAAPDHHIVLQELVHGESLVNGMDLSYRVLVRVAELKLRYPEQVHHLLSNHELAQAKGESILKGSVSSVDAFDDGLDYVFGDEEGRVAGSIERYVKALPLAVRCANGVLCAHSLPRPRLRGEFDPAVLDRELSSADYASPNGSARMMVWGRGLTQEMADDLAERWGVSVFVLGHQHAEMGWQEMGESMLVLNSDHAHAAALPIDLARHYSRNELTACVVMLAGV